ncbi:hypothetical protein [Futiania mangrovi]|uniref:Uncharacterized protein n=1 Tax=Futiania mangrovi TaxID=2959716 RepID=A0A9J6PMB6_9PROT|nr:hypothetical protein [Futiania mangrovii]MCP1337815.1 hypothetical protein [Futiania mangrovii]
MSTAVFTVLVIVALCSAVVALSFLAEWETRTAGRVAVAPKLLLGLFGGVVGLFYLDGAMVSSRGADTVRLLFRLPDDVALGRIYGGSKEPVCYRRAVSYRTTVEFTPDQFARYVALVDDRSVWRPVNPPHYLADRSHLQFSDDALAWQELPEPGWSGRQQLVWNIAGTGVRRGVALCQSIDRVDRQAPAEAVTSIFSVTPCNARARPRIPPGGGRVAAALDFDKQKLTIDITFDSKPDYCNNRISNWLGAALGLDTK